MLDSKIELVPNLVRGHRRDGRCLYDKAAKREAHGLNANLLRKWWMRSVDGFARDAPER
jgi:hypothetical protein